MSEHDEVIRGYSPAVMRRLLGYVKPYKLMAFLTILTLSVATVAELLMPVVMRRALDDHVLTSWSRLELESIQEVSETPVPLTAAMLQEFQSEGVVVADGLFVPPETLSDWDREAKNQAINAGILDHGDWYLMTDPGDAALEIIGNHPDLFVSQGAVHAMTLENRSSLAPREVRALRSSDIQGVRRRSLQYFGLLIAVLIFTFGQVYLASRIGQRVMADMRSGLLSHIMRQSLAYLGRTPVGSLVSRIANDVETINEFFTNVTISFLKDFAIMIGVIAVLFALDSRLAVIASLTLPPTAILILVFRNRMRESFRLVRAKVSAVNAFLSERLSGMTTVQMFATEKRSGGEFAEKGDALLDAELGQMRLMAIFRPLIDLLSSASVALVIWYSTGMHDRGGLTLGVLIAFIDLIQKFFRPVTDIAEKFTILQSAMAGSERVFQLLDTKHRIPDEGSTDQEISGDIQFQNVHFSYVPGEPVLKGLDFRIEKGQTVAVVGATGAGKTTIANLLTRLWDVEEGHILLDRTDIRELPLDHLRRGVQPVQQDVFLFSGTIAENIDLGLGLSRDEVIRAAQLSRADAFIQALPEGYETMVAEGASNLSAGQRQLIAFARVIAHDPRVIILDEATANVDTETESLLQQGLESLLADRTALVIAHRLSTIRRADRILVLGHGTLLEDGSHDELMTLNGVYAKLYRLQFAEPAQTVEDLL